MGRNRRIITVSAEETIFLGEKFGKSLPLNSVVCLFGDLAAGKTTLVKGIAKGVANVCSEEVNSPTFTYLNIYGHYRSLYHFDLYRLHDADEFLALGFEEYFFAGGICCVEWSERISSILPEDAISIHLSHLKQNFREILICNSKNLNF